MEKYIKKTTYPVLQALFHYVPETAYLSFSMCVSRYEQEEPRARLYLPLTTLEKRFLQELHELFPNKILTNWLRG